MKNTLIQWYSVDIEIPPDSYLKGAKVYEFTPIIIDIGRYEFLFQIVHTSNFIIYEQIMVWKTKKTLHCKINKLTYLWVIGCITAFKEIEP